MKTGLLNYYDEWSEDETEVPAGVTDTMLTASLILVSY